MSSPNVELQNRVLYASLGMWQVEKLFWSSCFGASLRSTDEISLKSFLAFHSGGRQSFLRPPLCGTIPALDYGFWSFRYSSSQLEDVDAH